MATLKAFLSAHQTKAKKDTTRITHTRIPSKDNGIYGGSYIIEGDEEDEFYDLVYKEVIQGGKLEYLTEKQHRDGVIYIDLDFRYEHAVQERQHDEEWIKELVSLYLWHLKSIFKVKPEPVWVGVMQKDGVNRLQDGSLTKDGIHVVIGLNCPHKLQLKLREMVMGDDLTKELLGKLPLTNDAKAVFDEGLSKGTTNCQLFGCRKPTYDAYKLAYAYQCEIDPNDNEWMMEDASTEMTKETFLKLCVRPCRGDRVDFEMTADAVAWLNPALAIENEKKRLAEIARAKIFEGTSEFDYILKLYRGLSPERAESGNYTKWYQLGQATMNILGQQGRELFGSFTQTYGSYNKQQEWEAMWDKLVQTTGAGSLTVGSLHYWCREDNPEYYAEHFRKQDEAVAKQEIVEKADEIADQLIDTPTDVQFAKYFVAIFGKEFVCTDVKNKIFHQFTKECIWVRNEGGSPIRLLLSHQIKDTFKDRLFHLIAERQALDDEDEDAVKRVDKKINSVKAVQEKLERTNDKNNFLREIQDFILDADFEKDMNKQQYLLPCKGKKVLDLRTLKVSDRNQTHKFNYECDAEYRDLTEDEDAEISKYFDELFCGNEGTKQCVLDILKSCLTGATLRYIYFITGTGRNGKSLLFSILNAILKNAMDIVSKDIILKKKSNSNITTEFEKLDRCRIGYTTELKEEDQLAENIIKAVTGGDPINVRRLHKTDETLIPTTNLFVITNELPKFKAEQAIKDRLIIIPFNNTFPVNKGKETEMHSKKDLIFSFIMKHGKIVDKFDLTEEMMSAKSEYEQDNTVDHLQDFLEARTIKVAFPADAGLIGNKDKVLERDNFIKEYNHWKAELKKYEPSQSNPTFTRRMKKLGYDNIKSGAKTYYKGLTWGEQTDEEVGEYEC